MRILSGLTLASILIASCTGESQRQEISADDLTIRAARQQSNQAIADKDTITIDKVWMEDFLVISSRDYQIEGKAANRKLFVSEFQSKPDVIYVRTPTTINVMEQWNMASENGTWEGSWTDQGSKIEISGSYYAKWHKVNGDWLLRVEVFTPEHCSGGSYCESKPVNN